MTLADFIRSAKQQGGVAQATTPWGEALLLVDDKLDDYVKMRLSTPEEGSEPSKATKTRN